jgi:hypothetical protein
MCQGCSSQWEHYGVAVRQFLCHKSASLVHKKGVREGMCNQSGTRGRVYSQDGTTKQKPPEGGSIAH